MAKAKPEEVEELELPNRVGKVAVTAHCDACDVDVELWIPEGHTDAKVRFEHPCSPTSVFKGEWLNPDAPEPVAEPGPDDDVIWDGEQQCFVPRVVANVVEGGNAVEAQHTS